MTGSTFPLTTRLRLALRAAGRIAAGRGNLMITPHDLLDGLGDIKGSLGAEIMRPSAKEPKLTKEPALEPVSESGRAIPISRLTPEARSILVRAATCASEAGHPYVGTEHLLFALVESDDPETKKHLMNLENGARDLKRHVKNIIKSTTKFAELTAPFEPHAHPHPAKHGKRQHSILEHVGRDLTDQNNRKHLDPVIGREREINRLIHILARRTKNNPVLIGAPGVGKTAIVEGLASAIADAKVPAPLLGMRLVALDLNALVAGTIYRGEFESRMQALVEEVRENPDVILFIDELHTIIGAGSGSGSLDAANILKPALARGELRCIGATTLTEYKRIISFDPALNRRFQPVLVEEPNSEDTLTLLQGIAPKYEDYHEVKITPDALSACVRLAARHVPGSFFPDKAIDLLDEACARVAVHAADRTEKNFAAQLRALEEEKGRAVRRGDLAAARDVRSQAFDLAQMIEMVSTRDKKPLGTVTGHDVAAVVAERTHVPLATLLLDASEADMDLAPHLKQTIVGQDPVIDEVARAIRRSRVGMAPNTRPVASFLFVGPSGVGKTALALTLARALFGDEKRCVRVDMSECSERFMTSRLIGAPAGYVGYREGGALTEAVKQQPACVVLLDEIEKAHPDIPNLLLQVLDEGRLTDAEGTPVDFRNTVLIITSNVGQDLYAKNGGFGFGTRDRVTSDRELEEREEKLMEHLREILPGEFLNRFDRVLPFRPLGVVDLEKIVTAEVARLSESLAGRGVKISLDQKAAQLIARHNEVMQEGARTIRRLVTNMVADPITDLLLKDPQKQGLIEIGTKGSKLTFTWVPLPPVSKKV